MPVADYFQTLGRRIDREWHQANFEDGAFSRISSEALDDLRSPGRVSARDVVRWGLTEPNLPEQFDVDAEFGEPPVTTFRGRGFFIAVQFWATSSTAIHDHGFSGAFQVLEGGSLETRFSFEPRKWINRHMAVGRLEESSSESLKPGDTRELPIGATIHSLFHLEQPSATIVVRRPKDPGAWPQLSYFRPGVALDPFYYPSDLRRRVQLLSLLGQSRPTELTPTCLRFLRGADFVSQFVALRRCATLLSPDDGDALIERAGRVCPEVASLVGAVVESDRRELFVMSRRKQVTDADLRFFLAVLLNVRGRERALALISRRFPKSDPVKIVLKWVRELARIPGPDAGAVSALGFQLDEVVVGLIEESLRGSSDAKVDARMASLAGRPIGKRERRDILRLRSALVHSEMFRSILES